MEKEGFKLHEFIPGKQRKSSQKHCHKNNGWNKDLGSAALTLGTWGRVSVWMETKLSFKKYTYLFNKTVCTIQDCSFYPKGNLPWKWRLPHDNACMQCSRKVHSTGECKHMCIYMSLTNYYLSFHPFMSFAQQLGKEGSHNQDRNTEGGLMKEDCCQQPVLVSIPLYFRGGGCGQMGLSCQPYAKCAHAWESTLPQLSPQASSSIVSTSLFKPSVIIGFTDQYTI